MRVEVWSDVVCPWCYIGKRRLESALARFEHADQVEVEWHSYQLDPSFPRGERRGVHEVLARKTGGTVGQARRMTAQVSALAAEEGLVYDLDSAVMVNTLDAHRVAHLAAAHGVGAAVHERLLRAHLVEGEPLDDHGVLVALAAEEGVPADEARRVLAGDTYADSVARDAEEARRLGANGVPFFVLDRAYGVAGAQQAATLLSALRTAYEAAPTAD